MLRKIFKTGHSAAVTLSSKILKELGLKMGDSVKMTVEGEKLVIRHSRKQDQLSLDLKVRPKLGQKK